VLFRRVPFVSWRILRGAASALGVCVAVRQAVAGRLKGTCPMTVLDSDLVDGVPLAVEASWGRPAPAREARALLVLGEDGVPAATIQHVYQLAIELGAELHVLRVLPPERRFSSPLEPTLHSAEGPTVERRLLAAGELRRWCDDVLPERLPPLRLRARVGHFASEAVTDAADLDAAMVVVAPGSRRVGAAATAIARATRRPVLVARPSARPGPVLVGTILDAEDSPVFSRALDIATCMGRSLFVVHNISHLFPSLCMPVAALASVAAVPATTETGTFGAGLDTGSVAVRTMTTHKARAADAIVEQARLRRAPIVVVGTRRRSWLERLIEPSVAAEVADRADCSVFITACVGARSF
jgi:nucleotide-binding universal stress UspA family protein